ncbi:MAG: hypothetical protein ACE149_04020 [Armatimonadota bacterium]
METEQKASGLSRALPGEQAVEGRRNWLQSAHHQLPITGYWLGFAVCWGLSYGGVSPSEWTWFVLLPSLYGLSHLVAPREFWRWKAYRILPILWLAAGVSGLLAHWTVLDPYTPWLSLVRYVLIAVGGTLVLAVPRLVAPDCPPPVGRLRRWGARAAACLTTTGWLAFVAVVVVNTPFKLALAPPEAGGDVESRSEVWIVRGF